MFKCKKQICAGESYGISEYGEVSKAENMTLEKVRGNYRRLLKNAKIEIMFVGREYSDCVEIKLKKYLPKKRQANIVLNNEIKERNIHKIISSKESMELSQEKLVMGFDFSAVKTEKEKNCIRIFAYIFGNSSNTGLFIAIREKLNLCYYCSASADIMSGIMLVECGIEKENHDKTTYEILKEFKKYQKEGITEEELSEGKLAIIGEISEVKNFINMTEDWYMNQIMDCKMYSPDEQIKNIEAITAEDVFDAVKKIKYVSVFALN